MTKMLSVKARYTEGENQSKSKEKVEIETEKDYESILKYCMGKKSEESAVMSLCTETPWSTLVHHCGKSYKNFSYLDCLKN